MNENENRMKGIISKIIQDGRKNREKILRGKKSDYGDMTQHDNSIFVCFFFFNASSIDNQKNN
jgi:hypothetical protein